MDLCDLQGNTALLWAVRSIENRLEDDPSLPCKQIQIITDLIHSGADLNNRNNNGENAIILAAKPKHHLEAQDNPELSIARAKVIMLLAEFGTDVNARDNQGKTALISSAYFGHPKVMRALIEAKADSNIRDNQCKSALDYAEETPAVLAEEIINKSGVLEILRESL
jgi:ankyrin repeat protein